MLPPVLAVRAFNCDRKRYREIERGSATENELRDWLPT